MGLAMSVPQLLIILVIVALVFGTNRLKTLGGDLGGALRSFRKAMNTGEAEEDVAGTPPKQLPAESKAASTADEKAETKTKV